MKTIRTLLKEFDHSSLDTRDKGTKFELLIQEFLRKDKTYKNLYSDVWLWSEYAQAGSKNDTGIDLVAQERLTQDIVAIQCKFYSEDHTLQKADIDSFFTASGKAPFSKRIIFSTTSKWGKNALDACINQQIPVIRMGIADLEQSSINWELFSFENVNKLEYKKKKELRDHQKDALEKTREGFKANHRGKLIMACGTGKTYTSLKIMEDLSQTGDNILFLVPSISLLSQTIREWNIDTTKDLNCFAICSDSKAGKTKHKSDNNDNLELTTTDLSYPATTNIADILKAYNNTISDNNNRINIFFSTYQSIDVLIKAQKQGLPDFNLVICDEAHRTTGVEKESGISAFNKVHNQAELKADKRLYMTATPRIYSDETTTKAFQADKALYSMDDPKIYGKEFYRIGFGEAVEKDLLTDYKVIVFSVEEDYINENFQDALAQNGVLNVNDTAKIIGCWNGLNKKTDQNRIPKTMDFIDKIPMKRAVAFCKDIKTSKAITDEFSNVIAGLEIQDHAKDISCSLKHVDGTQNVMERNQKLSWLAEENEENECRILTNARCLSEGVDVPNLDAVIFLNPRNSQVDIVQAVGRVMRLAEGKKYGYIIIPVAIPQGTTPEDSLNQHEPYKAVWSILQALRSHDDRFNAMVNKIDLNTKKPDNLEIGLLRNTETVNEDYIDSESTSEINQTSENYTAIAGQQFSLSLDNADYAEGIYAKLVEKVGERTYWETWAKQVSHIARTHIARITKILEDHTTPTRKAFERFVKGLHKIINDSITHAEAIEMLAQHLITKPVFDALFADDQTFTKNNPISKAMEKMLQSLSKHNLHTENKDLESFYRNVENRANGIDNLKGKQTIITELYEKFFQIAFPKLSKKHGLVYTPVAIVDFMINSVEHILQKEFNTSFNNDGVSVLDPFTGTGTFLVRLLQSGLITPDQLKKKYNSELYAHEIILLAYYLATVNIEQVYHQIQDEHLQSEHLQSENLQSEDQTTDKKTPYTPFKGAILTDTFAEHTKDQDLSADDFFEDNQNRKQKEQSQPIKVIIGNPPYSAGQSNANENNANNKYDKLDQRIAETYGVGGMSGNKNALYDSYMRAFRWSSDKVADNSVISFITNGGYINNASCEGFRKSIKDEFSSIHIFNLRGNGRVAGIDAKKSEGGNVFDIMTSVAIIILVKNTTKQSDKFINYYDIGEYQSKQDKMNTIISAKSIKKLTPQKIIPDSKNDWLNQRDDAYYEFMELGNKKNKQAQTIFNTYSLGIQTKKDSYVINSSKETLFKTVNTMIDYYNEERELYHKSDKSIPIQDFVKYDETKMKWDETTIKLIKNNIDIHYNTNNIRTIMYRNFETKYIYTSVLTARFGLFPKIYPLANSENIHIAIAYKSKNFSALISNIQSDVHFLGDSQNFPLYHYEENKPNSDLLSNTEEKYIRHDAINDQALTIYQNHYQDDTITKEDIFYYIYGLFHSSEYKTKYANNLAKEMPRIPMSENFQTFTQIGKQLADLHLNYETLTPDSTLGIQVDIKNPEKENSSLYHVTRQGMKYAKKTITTENGKTQTINDPTTIIFNPHITISNIPETAYNYKLNGTPAIHIILQRYKITTDKKSTITNNPNLHHPHNPKYILNLLLRTITLSLKTTELTNNLPDLGDIK